MPELLAERSVREAKAAGPADALINVWMREDGLVLDKLVLTRNASFIPTDLGPAESSWTQ